MIVLDSNTLLILIIGLINPNLFENHDRTSVYDEDDYDYLLSLIQGKKVLLLPNIWTEIDNLLGKTFNGNYKNKYVEIIRNLVSIYEEQYLHTKIGVNEYYYYDLALTDSLILNISRDADFLITSDSLLGDYARANSIKVIDLKERKNQQLKS